MKRSTCSYLVSCFILSSFLFDATHACWGGRAPDYGESSPDIDLLEGSDLVLNCSLKETNVNISGKLVNSSDLVIEKGEKEFSRFTQVIDDRTIQMKIPNVTINDAGTYVCKVFITKEYKPAFCGTKVNVGYPPHHVKKFSCISRNFDNLNCTWNTEENNVFTRYTIVSHYLGNPNFARRCPTNTARPNSCEWSKESDPEFNPYHRNHSFTITGNNALGKSMDNFTVDIYSIVIPNSPEGLEILNIGEQAATVKWKPPAMESLLQSSLPFIYEVRISKISYDSAESTKTIAEVNTTTFLFENLIPHVTYNVSVRCRSMYSDMWSNFTSLEIKTLADVPYKVPDVIPEAFELHLFEHMRSATLYWKAVPKLYHNGESFHYHIKYYTSGHSKLPVINTLNTSNSFVTVKNLEKNVPYTFEIYSANEKGLSKNFGSIIIDSQNRIPPAPKEIKVISQDIGHYNITWIPPNEVDTFSYIIFWCSSSTPWLYRCDDNSIHWTNRSLSDTNILLNISDDKKNFQFAVASKTGIGSSSMEWASCILPHKGGLSKIKYVYVEQKTSTTLKVIWNLDCPAEKAQLKNYIIKYCRVEKHEKCLTAEADPGADNYLLRHLTPYTNYSIQIRAINKHNKSSEESEKKYQSTLPGAPSGPPQDINVLPNGTGAFFVKWKPPLQPNGIITSYIVHYNSSKKIMKVSVQHNNTTLPDYNATEPEYHCIIDGLRPFSTYAVQIQACVNNDCSERSQPVMIRTEVDVPGYMEPPRIEEVDSNSLKVSWAAPITPNGPIDFYVIEWHPEKKNGSSISNNTFKVSGATSAVIDVKCPSLGDEGTKYLFYVKAVNKKNGRELYGPLSTSTQAKACQMTDRLGMLIGTIIGAAFGAIFFLVVIYRVALWMKIKIDLARNIKIRLPKELEGQGPETNPLNNYDNFKNGLNGNLQPNKGERLSYVIDENKNRHGSGSSQYSNSSTEEVAYKNEKCAKFGRKPSGDSSGCSSMSSSITPRTHLSSGTDSGAECEFVIPPSPDSGVTEPILLNTHKTPLPILMEVHDQHSSSEKNVPQIISPLKHNNKLKNTTDDIILKIDPPYSKFGYTGNASSSVLWRVNPLVFYNCNLANSEPSVFDKQSEEKSEAVFAPYSKVGLAKSSGDVGITNAKQNGYSKFGYPSSQKRFSIPPPNHDPIAMVMLENPDKREWPIMKKLLEDKYSLHKIKNNKQITPSNNMTEDTGYIKVGKNKMSSNAPSKGYVPFHEVRNQMDQNQPFNVDNSDHTNMYLNGNDQTEFSDDTEWPSFNNHDEENNNNDTPEMLFDVPFSENTPDCLPLDGRVFITNNDSCSPLGSRNSDDSLPMVPSDSDIKLSSDSPVLSLSEISFENNSFMQQPTGPLPRSIRNPSEISVSKESHSSEGTNNKRDCYGIPNEVIVTPVTLKNGYVPLCSLSDSMCDKTNSFLPNNSKITNTQNCVSKSASPGALNYKPLTDNVGNKLLKQSLRPMTDPLVNSANAHSPNDTQICFENGNGYANLSLNYTLKTLPKMESEICEV